jgi:hypothetical protein
MTPPDTCPSLSRSSYLKFDIIPHSSKFGARSSESTAALAMSLAVFFAVFFAVLFDLRTPSSELSS